jgi:hypothetical protein
MSMYAQLLEAALSRRAPGPLRPTERSALHAVRRHRGELTKGRPPATDPDAVPTVLAREVGYDVALVELAAVLGIETGPSRFDQPRRERARLERAFGDQGIAIRTHPDARAGAPRRP